MLRVSEVYEKQIRTIRERPDGSEQAVFEKTFDTRESLINTDYIVSVHPYETASSSRTTKMEEVFPDDTKFSVLVVDGNSFRKSELVFVGSFEKFFRLLQKQGQ